MELLPQVVNYEIGSSMNFEAIKAQAVAATLILNIMETMEEI